jgi:DUF3102 family protein
MRRAQSRCAVPRPARGVVGAEEGPMNDVKQSNRLAVLAAEIKTEHLAAHAAMKAGIAHAIAAGERLNEAKTQLLHGQWLPWLQDHCAISERMAQRYMRLAKNKEKLKSDTVSDLTLRGALDALAQHLPPEEPELELPPRTLMPGEIEMPIADIAFRPELYPRSAANPELVERYRHFLRDLPAIQINQHHELIDGWHRMEAFRQGGAVTIRVRVVTVQSDLDHLMRAIQANANHGLQLPLDVEIEVKRKRDHAEALVLSIGEAGR